MGINNVNSSSIDYEKYYLKNASKSSDIDNEDQSIFEKDSTDTLETETCKDGKDDGKIGFFEGFKSFCKGAVNKVKEQVGGLVDTVKKHPIKTLASVAGVGALCVLGGSVAVAGLSIVGIGTAVVGAAKGVKGVAEGIKEAAEATTDQEKREALENIGGDSISIAENAAMGVASGVAAANAINTVKTGSVAAMAQNLDDAAESVLRNTDDAVYAATENIDDAAGALAKTSQEAAAAVIENADDAIKAGHEMGHSVFHEGKWYTFDKTGQAWLEDTSITSKMKEVDDFIAATADKADDAAGALAKTSQEAAAAVIENADDAIKAGHEMGHTVFRDGKWYTFDKTDQAWLEDTSMASKMQEVDDLLAATADKADDAASAVAENADDIAQNLPKHNFKNGNLSQYEWEDILQDEYQRLRGVGQYKKHYPADFSDDIANLQNAVDNPYSSDIAIIQQGGWNYRMGKNIPVSDIGERISLNVKGDSRLIKEMDILMNQGQYIDDYGNVIKIDVNDFYYKTYENVAKWGNREDPITIYCNGDFNTETLKAIEQITKKYVRGGLNGNSSSATPWIAKEINPTTEMIVDLIQQAEKVNVNLANAIRKNATYYNEYVMSSGQYKAYWNVIQEYLNSVK